MASPPTAQQLLDRITYISDHFCSTSSDPSGTMRPYVTATKEQLRSRLEADELTIERLRAELRQARASSTTHRPQPEHRSHRYRREWSFTWLWTTLKVLTVIILLTTFIFVTLYASGNISQRKVDAFIARMLDRTPAPAKPTPPIVNMPHVRLDNRELPVRAERRQDGKWYLVLRLKVSVALEAKDIDPLPDTSEYFSLPGGEPEVSVDQISLRPTGDGRWKLAPRMHLQGGVIASDVNIRVESIRVEE